MVWLPSLYLCVSVELSCSRNLYGVRCYFRFKCAFPHFRLDFVKTEVSPVVFLCVCVCSCTTYSTMTQFQTLMSESQFNTECEYLISSYYHQACAITSSLLDLTVSLQKRAFVGIGGCQRVAKVFWVVVRRLLGRLCCGWLLTWASQKSPYCYILGWKSCKFCQGVNIWKIFQSPFMS